MALASAVLLLPTTIAAFAATTNNGSESWTVPNWDYTTQANLLGPYLYWKLDETGATVASQTAADASGNGRTGQYNGNLVPNVSATYFTRGITGALDHRHPEQRRDAEQRQLLHQHGLDHADQRAGRRHGHHLVQGAHDVQHGGKLAGFEKPRVGVAAPSTGTYDRHALHGRQRQVWFGVYNGGVRDPRLDGDSTTATGTWPSAPSGPAGTRLYIDGVLNASNGNTAAEATTGWWRAGCGNLAGWGGAWGGRNNPTTDSTVPPEPAVPGLARRDHRLQLRDVRRQDPVPLLGPLSRGLSGSGMTVRRGNQRSVFRVWADVPSAGTLAATSVRFTCPLPVHDPAPTDRKRSTTVKPDIHPSTSTRRSPAPAATRSPRAAPRKSGTIHADVCSACHPFYTGKQKILDTGGRVARFEERFGKQLPRTQQTRQGRRT